MNSPRPPPPPFSLDPILVIARWKTFALKSRKKFGTKKAHVYSLAAWPSARISEGSKIRLLALSKPQYHLPLPLSLRFDSYDPHIVGCIAKIRCLPEGLVSATIVNECWRNAVSVIELEIPNVEDVLCSGSRPRQDRIPAQKAAAQLLNLCEISPPGPDRDCGGLDCIAPAAMSWSISGDEEDEWIQLSDIEESSEEMEGD